MAKLKGPLFSLGASQQLGKALVFFNWKGLNVVREHVVPSNPRTALQVAQRQRLADAIIMLRVAQSQAANPLDADDVTAYALWASVVQSATTWFNQWVRHFVDRAVALLGSKLFTNGGTTPGASSLAVQLYDQTISVTAGTFYSGTSRTALVDTQAATVVAASISATIAGLTTGTKYYWQFRATAPASHLACLSGIYYGVAA